ncbi:peptidylprolyl isomerase [Microbaculum marinum]|uniref:Parvulin-like PPIase n=1 Tax=Microbaculum marinum TaxID=1764581 RepID=A0AAW9RJH4_9HYPH
MKFYRLSSSTRLFAGGLIAILVAAAPALAQDTTTQDTTTQDGAAAEAAAPETAAPEGAGDMAAGNTAVARINGKVITEGDLAIAEQDIGESIPDLSEAERRDYLVTYLTDLMIVSEAARKAGVADDPAFQKRMDYMVDRNLMEKYLNDEGMAAATEDEARKLYDEVIKEVPEQERVRARHILVETEDEAKEIKKQLDEGGDFAALAREKSKDPGSGKEGGELGWFTKEEMVPEFAEAAFALEPGQISEPVKSDFGWHIIKTEGKRNKPGFDEVEGELYEMVARQRQRDIIMSLRETADVEKLYEPAAETDGKDKGKKSKTKAGKKKNDEATEGAEPASE